MGDEHRFNLFADLIARNTSGRDWRVVDVAGGKGHLRHELHRYKFKQVETVDGRVGEHLWKTAIPVARGHKQSVRFFDYRKEKGHNLVVAMHPDEGTDHAVMYAKQHNCQAFICPCCVRPSAVDRGHNGRSKFEWRRHLQELVSEMRTEWVTLPIQGDADVLMIWPRKG